MKLEIGPTFIEKATMKFYDNIFIRFFVWFLFILVLTSVIMILLSQKLPLSPDTMVTISIGTSIAGAAALAGFLPSKPK